MAGARIPTTFGFYRHSRFCHQLSFVPLPPRTSLIFIPPLPTSTFALCLTAFTIVLPDALVTPLLTVLPFTTFVTTVATREEIPFGVAWLDGAAGCFLAPVT